MNRQGQIPRSRGGICGVLLILLGLWGGLAPFVGPYFHFGFTPDKAWAYNSGRLYYSIIPGAAALLGGLLVTVTRNRGAGVAGGLLAALGGVWFIGGRDFVFWVLKKSISAGGEISTLRSGTPALRPYLETISFFTGLGILVLVAGGIAMGRFSMVAASDVAADGAGDGYESEFPSAPAVQAARSYPTAPAYPGAQAGQADLSQYPTTAGQFGSGADPATTTQSPPSDLFAPTPFPEAMTSHFPPETPS